MDEKEEIYLGPNSVTSASSEPLMQAAKNPR
jgi:hypothetical protein